MSTRALATLERCRDDFSPGVAARKLAALRLLARARLRAADQVRRLHEVLCFMRAYPQNPGLLRQVERMLDAFEYRRDLRTHRGALACTGIAGTTIWFPFFYPTARWIAQRWPDALTLDRTDAEAGESIAKALPCLTTAIEAHSLRESHLPGFQALDALRGRCTDATFLVELVGAMPGDDVTREAFYDLINPSCELIAADGTPSRTRAVFPRGPRSWQTSPLRHERPDLRREIARPPRTLRRLSAADGRALVILARESMLTRQRDLDAFAHGSEADVWLCEDDGGLAFALIGTRPDRRVPLPAIYGGLTLQNGVPIGYHQADLLGRSAAVSFNTFETFRGSESAHTFARLLATLHAFCGATSFSIEPYQLGQGNDEGIDSGAWWFYFKLGFRPRARAAMQMAAVELDRVRKRPSHRTRPETLRKLAEHHVFLDLEPERPAPLLLPSRIGLRVGEFFASLAPGDRARAMTKALEVVRQRCGPAPRHRYTRNERAAWSSLAPLFAAIPMRGWSAADRAALISLALAKGAQSERAYARLLGAHRKLEAVLAEWSSARQRTA